MPGSPDLLDPGALYTRAAMAYARDDIEKIRQATNIVDLMESVTTVQKRGRTVKAICPFHQEKTPSVSIDVARGLYHCFGCGEGGDIFKFVEQTQALSFSEAVEYLAARAGLPLRRDAEASKRRGERQQLVEAVEKTVAFYNERLKSGSDAGAARAYLRGRGYDSDVVERFNLGFSPVEGWDLLVHHLKATGVTERTMLAAGLAARNRTGRLRDWFRGRVMFPIYDTGGSPVGFGARLLEGEGPKYLNSPETRLYQKARLLYGLNWAKSAIARGGQSLVVEGYTDVIGLHLAGMPIAVATCGTALGEDHFDLLRRFSERIVLAFDADEAGVGAALRGDELQTPADLELDVRVALMPQGKDPADLVQAGELEALRGSIDASRPLLEFRIERELARHNLDEAAGRARAVRATAALIARQSDEIARTEYARMVSRGTGVELNDVRRAIADAGRKSRPDRRRAPQESSDTREPSGPLTGRQKAERDLIRLVLAGHPDVDPAAIDADWFSDRGFRAGFEAISGVARVGEAVDLGEVRGSDELLSLLRSQALSDVPLARDPSALLRRLERFRTEEMITVLQEQVEAAAPDSDTYSALLRELIGLERRKRELDAE